MIAIRTKKLTEGNIIPLNFDFAFTSIFNNEKNIDILENFLSVYLNVPLEKLKGKVKLNSRELPLENKKAKRKQVDLIVDLEGEKINIELSNQIKNQGVIDRNIVYACSIHARQLKYRDQKYQNIQKTLQINLNNFKCNKGKLKESYYIQTEEGKKLSEKFQIDIIDMEIGKGKCYTGSERKLARWCKVLTVQSMKELKEILGEDLMTRESKEKLLDEVQEMSKDNDVIALYSAYTQDELEKNSILYEETEKAREKGLAEGREVGLKQGLEQGLEQGEKLGIQEEKVAIARSLISMGMKEIDISKATGLSISEIQKL